MVKMSSTITKVAFASAQYATYENNCVTYENKYGIYDS